ncbi:unnamed protein product, partial [Urochloa humidicola]
HPKATGDAEAAPASCLSRRRPRLRPAPSSPRCPDPATRSRSAAAAGRAVPSPRGSLLLSAARSGARRVARVGRRGGARGGRREARRRRLADPSTTRGGDRAGRPAAGLLLPAAEISWEGRRPARFNGSRSSRINQSGGPPTLCRGHAVAGRGRDAALPLVVVLPPLGRKKNRAPPPPSLYPPSIPQNPPSTARSSFSMTGSSSLSPNRSHPQTNRASSALQRCSFCDEKADLAVDKASAGQAHHGAHTFVSFCFSSYEHQISRVMCSCSSHPSMKKQTI